MVDLYWAEGAFPGRLAVAGRPRGGSFLADDIAAFGAHGVGALVSTLGPKETRDAQLEHLAGAARGAGIEFLHLPIPNLLAPSIEGVIEALRRLAAMAAAGVNVAVHCWAGIGRSPLIVSSVLVLLGLSAEEAWLRVETARMARVPDTHLQRAWVHDLARFAGPVPGVALMPSS
ncbi:MAG: dual specificity protein phosphatase family protein [Chloroflexi bacterium]|nr:dual specificity protein phosphatase family protein [Chloroflexota bacterium]